MTNRQRIAFVLTVAAIATQLHEPSLLGRGFAAGLLWPASYLVSIPMAVAEWLPLA